MIFHDNYLKINFILAFDTIINNKQQLKLRITRKLPPIDLSVFENIQNDGPHNNIQCTFNIWQCNSIQRIIMALRYYQPLKMDIITADNEVFTNMY